jgi:hypothetical protein
LFFETAEKSFLEKPLSNKDGGAHVDTQLERYYETLCAGKYAFGVTGNLTFAGPAPFKQGVTYYPKNAHVTLLRQFAHELLNSAIRYRWPTATGQAGA